MTGFLSHLGIREARVLAHSCPLGTSGRIHALRLRRRFQQPASDRGARKQSTTAEAEKVLEKEITSDQIKKIQNEIRSKVRGSFNAPEASSNAGKAELTINGEPLDIAQFAPHSSEKPKYPPLYRPSKLRTDKHYSQFFYDYSQLLRRAPEANPDAPAAPAVDPLVISAEVDKVLETGDHHTAVIAIGRLASLPPLALSEVSSEKFTALLELMDAKYFFNDHIRFDRYIPSRSPFYIDFFAHDSEVHHPRNVFLRLLSKIIKARKAAGWPLTKADHQYILHTRRILGDVSKIPLNVQLHAKKSFPGEVEAFNNVMGSLVEGGIWASNPQRMLKQITARYWPRNDEAAKEEQVNKGRIAYVFQQLTDRGIAPNEETMCLMMTVFAREGDMEGIKQIFDSVWGINIYKFLALGEEGIGKDFPHDSPVRPTGRLLETIAHIFGTNQDIPLALRLMDFVSRRYSLSIPLSAWEEILERTYTLSTYKKSERIHSTSPDHPRKPLPGTSVHSLWRTMTSPPYNVQPNIHMYDKVIRSLIAKQRFGIAEELMEEGRVVHKESVRRHRALLKGWAWQVRNPDAVTIQERIELDHKIWMANMTTHRSRQYIRQWVRGLIYRSDKNEYRRWENSNYMAGVVERWKLFLPKVVKYDLPTGRVNLKHDGLEINKERVRGFQNRSTAKAVKRRAEGKERKVEEDEERDAEADVEGGEIPETRK